MGIARNRLPSPGSVPNNNVGRGPIRLATAIHAADRLRHGEQAKFTAEELDEYKTRRRLFLDQWHALIELGAIAPCWTSFAQRLDYVGECANLEHEEWAKKAGMEQSVVSMFRIRARGQAHPASVEASRATAKHTYSLLQVAGQEVELPWVIVGTRVVDERSFADRYREALEIAYPAFNNPDGGYESAIKEGLFSRNLKADQESLAEKLSQHSKSIFSKKWLLTGNVTSPVTVSSEIEKLCGVAETSQIRDMNISTLLEEKKVSTVPKLLTPSSDRYDESLEWEDTEMAKQSSDEFIRENRYMVFLMAFSGESNKT